MREKTMFAQMPQAHTIAQSSDNAAIVTFVENAELVGENEVMADVYMLTVPWTHDITERVEANYEAWLAHAKSIDYEINAAKVRERRDALLAETDWTQAPDAPFTEEECQAWRLYRQALRDMPQQDGFPYAVAWPDKP